MTDELIILLSTDWFFPLWGLLETDIPSDRKFCVQKGSRELVNEIRGDAARMYQVDFSSKRKQDVFSKFLGLLKACGVEHQMSLVHREWESRSRKLDASEWLFFTMNQMIKSGKMPKECPDLDGRLRLQIVQVWRLCEFDFVEASEASKGTATPWDNGIHSLLGGGHILCGILVKVLRGRELQKFWRLLCCRLTSSQVHELILWYQAAEKVMTREDKQAILPFYVM